MKKTFCRSSLFLLSLSLMTSVLTAKESKVWLNPVKAKWRVKTDKTERPGVGLSTLEVRPGSGSLQSKGLLYSIPGSKGPVGFALIETVRPIDASAFEKICFDFSGGPNQARYSVLLKDDQADQEMGTLTFQAGFTATEKKQKVCLALSDFTGTIRGKNFPEFELNTDSLDSFSIQIARSAQSEPLLSTSPLPFQFQLYDSIGLE